MELRSPILSKNLIPDCKLGMPLLDSSVGPSGLSSLGVHITILRVWTLPLVQVHLPLLRFTFGKCCLQCFIHTYPIWYLFILRIVVIPALPCYLWRLLHHQRLISYGFTMRAFSIITMTLHHLGWVRIWFGFESCIVTWTCSRSNGSFWIPPCVVLLILLGIILDSHQYTICLYIFAWL